MSDEQSILLAAQWRRVKELQAALKVKREVAKSALDHALQCQLAAQDADAVLGYEARKLEKLLEDQPQP